jgi:hypothetical protein
MIPFAVDANAIHAFQTERIQQDEGAAHAAVHAILSEHCIALDEEKLCLQEWVDCAGGRFPFALTDWIADQAATGKIRFFALASNACKKALRQNGLPAKDHKWVRLALGSGGNRIVSGDVDFFDPAMKQASAALKSKLRRKRAGPFARFLRRTYGVEVMCIEHVPEEVERLRA